MPSSRASATARGSAPPGLAFAWTIARGAWPGGADPRAVALARELGILLSS